MSQCVFQCKGGKNMSVCWDGLMLGSWWRWSRRKDSKEDSICYSWGCFRRASFLPVRLKGAPATPDVLYLTPVLSLSLLQEARKRSRVSVGEEYALSYSGFFTVNKTADSHHFVWFFPAKVKSLRGMPHRRRARKALHVHLARQPPYLM